MELTKEALQALQSIVGAENVSDDPVICESYTARGYGKDLGYEKVLCTRPACVIMPRTTAEVQRIVRLCNRYKIPFTPASAYWLINCAAKVPNCLLIDLKRMNDLEIDEKRMYAIVEPGVIYSQLQEQAMRRGLYTTVPGGGAQVSVLANHIHWGYSPLNYRAGMPSRRVLGVEWVLPNGEMLRLGSLAVSQNPFWGEGLGSDLRGIIRGYVGWFGGLGVVTRMAVKLFPFQPERLEPEGISPDTHLNLPTNRMRWYNFSMPSGDALIEAMYEMGKAEIGAAATKVPVFWRYIARAKSREHFWEMWAAPGKEEEIKSTYILRVLLIGYTSEEQLEYEEKVLMEIAKECGGELRRTRQTDESWIKNADSVGMWSMTGGYISVEGMIDTVASAVKGGEALAELKRGFTPPLMPDYGDPGWFQISELGHMGYLEFLTYFDPDDEDIHKVDQWVYVTVPKEDIRVGLYNAFTNCHQPLWLTGPAYGPNYHSWMQKLKEVFDPHNLSNPPAPFDNDAFVERAAWLKRDW
jgi:hypothetical protein